MVQGTSSDAGKSTLVTALCRIFLRAGIRVAPFKPQNMALNSAVTIDGGEIGRAQALQAQACGIEAHTDMNPVLLKPNTDQGAQVIIQGKAHSNMSAQQYHHYKPKVMDDVLTAHQRLLAQYQLVIAEGAGSPAEINLREHDIANMGFAEQVDCPVILVADIDRGGVFAQIVGTLALLSSSEQNRIIGFVINRFRGDLKLLSNGLQWLEQKTQKPVFGVIPYLPNLLLDAEDSLANANTLQPSSHNALKVLIPTTPRASNHTDFDPLRCHPEVSLQWQKQPQNCPDADLIILPGSKNVVLDLAWLAENGWIDRIKRHLRYGGKLLGICGGFQMLGNTISDPLGVETAPGQYPGLGLLDLDTHLSNHKNLMQRSGHWLENGAKIRGYEIHMGTCKGSALQRPVVQFEDGCYDGAISTDRQIIGTYLHGLFETAEACRALLEWAGLTPSNTEDYNQVRETNINRVADCVTENLDIEYIKKYLIHE